MREHLCPRCGSAERVQLTDTQSECGECGLGRTSSPVLTATAPPSREAGGNPWRDYELELLERDRLACEEADFTLYGLDERWTGLRSFGGHARSNGALNSVILSHGDGPWDESAPSLDIETQPLGLRQGVTARTHLGIATQEALNQLWMVAGVQPRGAREAAFDPYVDDPTASWDHRELMIDGVPVAAAVLGNSEALVGIVVHRDVIITMLLRDWELTGSALRTVTDVDDYARGSREFVDHWPRG